MKNGLSLVFQIFDFRSILSCLFSNHIKNSENGNFSSVQNSILRSSVSLVLVLVLVLV